MPDGSTRATHLQLSHARSRFGGSQPVWMRVWFARPVARCCCAACVPSLTALSAVRWNPSLPGGGQMSLRAKRSSGTTRPTATCCRIGIRTRAYRGSNSKSVNTAPRLPTGFQRCCGGLTRMLVLRWYGCRRLGLYVHPLLSTVTYLTGIAWHCTSVPQHILRTALPCPSIFSRLPPVLWTRATPLSVPQCHHRWHGCDTTCSMQRIRRAIEYSRLLHPI